MCNTPYLNTHKDLHFRRQVGQTLVYCFQKSSGCVWMGPVHQLDQHLQYNQLGTDEDCRYVEVLCPYQCRMHIARRKLKKHMQEDCEKRQYRCNYCDEEGPFGYIVNSHLPLCPKFPTKCPKGCDDMMKREELKLHLENDCQYFEVPCEFAYAGCTNGKVRRKDMTKHMDDNCQAHMKLLAAHDRKKDAEIEALKEQVQLLTATLTRRLQTPQELVAPNAQNIGFVAPPRLEFKSFNEYASKKRKWRSPSFYSHVGGYKMCLLVLPNSQVDAEGNQQVGVYLQMLKGEFDDVLKWPFYGKVVVRLINQKDPDSGHINHTLIDDASYRSSKFSINMVNRVVGMEATSCWGCVNFASMSTLVDKSNDSVQYVRDNMVVFQVTEVSLLNRDRES